MINDDTLSFNGLLFTTPVRLWDFKDKQKALSRFVFEMLSKTQQIFEYTNLPETITARNLERLLQVNGVAVFYQDKEHTDGKLYAFYGNTGGYQDAYGEPTQFIISDPSKEVNFISKTLDIGKDCEIIRNDSMRMGLLPIIEKYGTLLIENEITVKSIITAMRAQAVGFAGTGKDKAAIDKWLNDLEAGKQGSILSDKFDNESLANIQPLFSSSSVSALRECIEAEQYYKSALLHALGLNSQFNMKRETLNESETEVNKAALLPFVENMLRERREGLERANSMFGTSMSVKLASAWDLQQTELEAATTKTEAEADQAEAEANQAEAEADQAEAEADQTEEADQKGGE